MISAAFFLSACKGENAAFNAKFELPETGWHYKDTLSAEIKLETGGVYRIGVQLETTNDYPYRNLQVKHCLAGEVQACAFSRSNHYLQNAEGAWHGEQDFSGNYRLFALLEEEAKLNAGESYAFQLVHDLRADTLAGVRNIELVVLSQ